ncbi:MAG: hypothetical protein GXY44_14790 [Phycisphaerales bacterium]|nr:hypothetical protein [Phycisphaerales bacterium]
MDRAVILVSGGINSAVAAAVAREQYEPAWLHVSWAHRAADRELLAFEMLAADAGVQKTIIAELSALATFGGNARVSKRLPMEDAVTLGHETPATFAFGLLPSMLSLAAAWAGSIGAKHIIVGISENHGIPGPLISELYPDYRREFLQTFNLMLEYAKPSGRELLVEAPLIELSRAEIIRLGQQLKVPFEKTWSCYRGNDQPCNRCLPCFARTTGFLRVGIPDPLVLHATSATR